MVEAQLLIIYRAAGINDEAAVCFRATECLMMRRTKDGLTCGSMDDLPKRPTTRRRHSSVSTIGGIPSVGFGRACVLVTLAHWLVDK